MFSIQYFKVFFHARWKGCRCKGNHACKSKRSYAKRNKQQGKIPREDITSGQVAIMVNYLNTSITTFLIFISPKIHIKQGLLFEKISFSQNENTSGSAFFKVYRSQNMVWYSRKFDISLALCIWKTIQKCPAILPKFLLICVSYACQFCVILFLVPIFFLNFFPSTFTHPTLYIGMFSPLLFVVFLFTFFTWRSFDGFRYSSFITCETSSIKNWFVLATRLAEHLTHMILRKTFVIQIC